MVITSRSCIWAKRADIQGTFPIFITSLLHDSEHLYTILHKYKERKPSSVYSGPDPASGPYHTPILIGPTRNLSC